MSDFEKLNDTQQTGTWDNDGTTQNGVWDNSGTQQNNWDSNNTQSTGNWNADTVHQPDDWITGTNTTANSYVEPPKKGKAGFILLAIGIIAAVAGIFVTFLMPKSNSNAEPKDIRLASGEGEYVSAPIYFMTESVAYFEVMDDREIYIINGDEEDDIKFTAICVKKSDLPQYQKYMDWTYDEDAEDPGEGTVVGYTASIDKEMKKYIKEGFSDIYGFELSDIEYNLYFNRYYIVVGEEAGQYTSSTLGIILFVVAAVFLILSGWKLLQKPETVHNSYMGNVEVEKGNFWLGVVGAILGAFIGGVLWTVIAILGYQIAYLAALMLLLAFGGYKLFAKREDVLGMIVCFVISAGMIILSMYMAASWQYYSAINDGMGAGFVSFGDCMSQTWKIITDGTIATEFWKDVAIGEIFMLVMGIAMIAGQAKKK